MTTEREPRTEAGRALLNTGDYIGPNFSHALAASILDIEAEAAREALEAVGHDLDADVDCRCTRFAATTWGSKP